MTTTEYQERITPLFLRLQNALRHNCQRTARARLRDIAHLENERNPTIPYLTLYHKLLDKYPATNKNT